MNKRICLIAEDYPTDTKPSYPFVQELAYSLSDEGWECYVIAPQSITRAVVRHEGIIKKKTIDEKENGKRINVYRPYIMTFSNSDNNLMNKITYKFYHDAIKKTIRTIGKLDYVYCYFWHMGVIAARAINNDDTKLIVQASECNISVLDEYKNEKYLNSIDGVVCASRKNYEESIENGFIRKGLSTSIIPNGFRKDQFYPIKKSEARKKLGFDQELFIVAFVGDFNDRKGTARLSEAIDRFEDVYSIFIGKGNVVPTCNNIVYQGLVPHSKLVLYLNCADVFVLPTQAEGCCNAIIEAIACGLPIISSKKSFNDEILDDSYSIRINENSIDEIERAIREVKENKEHRIQMSQNALKAAEKFNIVRRAQSITSFLESI